MKFGFVTCVELGLSCIEKIYEINGKLDLIITLKDNIGRKKSGRVYLDDFCSKNNIPLLKVKHINDKESISSICKYKLDWLFIIGWSQIASKDVVESPKLGSIGAHPTLLPKGRGRASIPWSIIKNLNYTGLTFFKLDEGVDTGCIIYQKKIKITKSETATTLYDKVNLEHANIIEKIWNDLCLNKINLTKQDDSKATYWEGRKPSDGQLFDSMTVEEVDRLVRATTKPYPGAFYILDKKYKIVIWSGYVESKPNKSNFSIQFSNGYYIINEYTKYSLSDDK
jgi:methionyl-tRNA formyltransferase